jgi:hypothetical protein
VSKSSRAEQRLATLNGGLVNSDEGIGQVTKATIRRARDSGVPKLV